MRRFLQGVSFFVIACLVSAAPLQAAVLHWVYGGVDRWFNTPGNWEEDLLYSGDIYYVDVTTDSPQIDGSHSADASSLVIGDTNSGLLEMLGGTLTVEESLWVGGFEGWSDGSLVMTGNSVVHKLASSYPVIFGVVAGHLIMSGSSQFNVDNDNNSVYFGHNNGTGYLDMTDTASVNISGGTTWLGSGGTAHATLAANAHINITNGALVIGAYGNTESSLTMSGASVINATAATNPDGTKNNAIIAGYLGGNGSIAMSGSATINCNGRLAIGDSSNVTDFVPGMPKLTTGTLTMSDDSVINTQNGNFHVGVWAGSLGQITMHDNAKIVMTGHKFLVGDNWNNNRTGANGENRSINTLGRGELTMLDNTKLLNPTGEIIIGNYYQSRGTMTMGSFPTTDNPEVVCDYARIGFQGDGDLAMYGGTFTARNGTEIGSGVGASSGLYISGSYNSGSGVSGSSVYATPFIHGAGSGGKSYLVIDRRATLHLLASDADAISFDGEIIVGFDGGKIDVDVDSATIPKPVVARVNKSLSGNDSFSGITKLGVGTLILTDMVRSIRSTVVGGGTLCLARNAVLESDNISVASGATLALDRSNLSNYEPNHTITLAGGSTLSLSLMPTTAAHEAILTDQLIASNGLNFVANAQGLSLELGQYQVITGAYAGPVLSFPV